MRPIRVARPESERRRSHHRLDRYPRPWRAGYLTDTQARLLNIVGGDGRLIISSTTLDLPSRKPATTIARAGRSSA